MWFKWSLYSVTGVTIEQYGTRWDNERPSGKFIVERRESIRFGVIISTLFVDKSVANNSDHVFRVARSWRVVNIRIGHLLCIHSVTGFVWKINKSIILTLYSCRFPPHPRFIRTLAYAYINYRLAGEENFRVPFENGFKYRQESAFDERNNFGHSSDQNVHVGKAVRNSSTIREKVQYA